MNLLGDTPYGMFNAGAWLYDRMTAQPFWREQIAGVLRYAEPLAPSVEVLDLGCGPGVSTFVLAERLGPAARLVGVDLAHKMVERARRNHQRDHAALTGVRFEQADATRLRFEAGRFDLAVGHSFLYLVSDRAAVLADVLRVLRPGGTLVLMEPNAGGTLVSAAARGAAHARHALARPWAAARFATSMALWRLVSAGAGQLGAAEVTALFAAAGFERVATHPTLGGLGLHCVGRKPGVVSPA